MNFSKEQYINNTNACCQEMYMKLITCTLSSHIIEITSPILSLKQYFEKHFKKIIIYDPTHVSTLYQNLYFNDTLILSFLLFI